MAKMKHWFIIDFYLLIVDIVHTVGTHSVKSWKLMEKYNDNNHWRKSWAVNDADIKHHKKAKYQNYISHVQATNSN